MSRPGSVLACIGQTPTMPLTFEPEGLTLWCKAEYLNPSGSIKDRLAACILGDARQRGALTPESLIVECSSGNTGIALSMVGAALGYRVRILMSAGASIERRRIMHHLGAEVVLFDSAGGYQVGIDLSRAMAAADPRIFLPRQFENPLNAEENERETGAELLAQVPGPIDAFVSGFGTGGTLAGCGRAVKGRYPQAQIVAMEPAEAALLAGECPCCHLIEGVADGFMPPLMRDAPVDREVKVTSAAAMAMTRRLALEYGLIVGTSSGANVVAALTVARELGPRAVVTTVLPDRAERYFSTALFEGE